MRNLCLDPNVSAKKLFYIKPKSSKAYIYIYQATICEIAQDRALIPLQRNRYTRCLLLSLYISFNFDVLYFFTDLSWNLKRIDVSYSSAGRNYVRRTYVKEGFSNSFNVRHRPVFRANRKTVVVKCRIVTRPRRRRLPRARTF